MSIFTTKYYSDPEYRAKHLLYMKQKIPCKICGDMIQRSNMSHHNKTAKTHKNIALIDLNKVELNDIDALITRLNHIKTEMTNADLQTI